jgi:hypothetical protein
MEDFLVLVEKFLADGGGAAGSVIKAWGLVSLGDWLMNHPYAFYVGAAVIVLGLITTVKAKS